jgi:hypothetical protein
MANNSLFINIACLLWTVRISPILDEKGTPILPDITQTLVGELVA